jgi:hypothetical protein
MAAGREREGLIWAVLRCRAYETGRIIGVENEGWDFSIIVLVWWLEWIVMTFPQIGEV